MRELIDRRTAIKAIDALPNCYNGFSDAYDKSCIIGVLEELPTIDAVPVVRCGECKWLFNDSNTFFKPCEVIIPEKDWYCAYGERRES